jgi:hypothetical protein
LGTFILSDNVINILSGLIDEPGFIGYKSAVWSNFKELVHGRCSHLQLVNVTSDHIIEIGIFGKVRGPLINWDRKVYLIDEKSGVLMAVLEIPFAEFGRGLQIRRGDNKWVLGYRVLHP